MRKATRRWLHSEVSLSYLQIQILAICNNNNKSHQLQLILGQIELHLKMVETILLKVKFKILCSLSKWSRSLKCLKVMGLHSYKLRTNLKANLFKNALVQIKQTLKDNKCNSSNICRESHHQELHLNRTLITMLSLSKEKIVRCQI